MTDVQPGTTQTIAAGQSGIFTTTGSFAGLAADTDTGDVTISGGGITKSIPVTLILTAISSAPNIALSPNSLVFSGTTGGASPVSKTFTVSNTAGGTLSWAASNNAAWRTLSPVSGTNSGTVTANVNLTGFIAGTYNATITITASGSTNIPQQIPVSLTLSATAAAQRI